MKVRWEYEGKQYVISGHKGGKMYLNKHLCNRCEEILEGLSSHDKHTRIIAKSKARRLVAELDEKHNHPSIAFNEQMEIYHRQQEEERRRDWEWECAKNDWPVWILGTIILGGIIYLIYEAWWLFVGHPAFEGPFSSQYSAGETTIDTIIFIIVIIVVIEEVIRRIINGHF